MTKSNLIKNILASIILVLVLNSCGDQKPAEYSGSRSSDSTTPVAKNRNETYSYISDENNVQIAEIINAPNGANINVKGATYFGEKKGDKMKYYDQQNNMRYEIKYKTGSFKLRDSNSELLWKIKTYDSKIKLADNEEMTNPIEIKMKSDKKYVIYKNGAEFKVIRIDPNKTPLNINNEYYTRGFSNNYHSAILQLEMLNNLEKYMIIAELNR